MRRFSVLAVAALMAASCSGGAETPPTDDSAPASSATTQPPTTTATPTGVAVEVLTEGYAIPDGIAVIGESEFLFAERAGTVYHYVDGAVTSVAGIPPSTTIVVDRPYGGLLDITVHPEFADNRLVYIAYDDSRYRLVVARFVLRDDSAEDFEVIYEANGFSIGSRIVWQDGGHFFLSLGIGGAPLPEPGAQDLGSDLGKIHRLTDDGQVPSDNPLIDGRARSSIWTYGHRNPQGLHYDAVTELLYAVEHGPLGGDELNTIEPGGNYGWPLFSYGLNYDRTPVSDLTEAEAEADTILPTVGWGPEFRVAPSGLVLLEGSSFPEWEGSFLLGSLFQQTVLRYDPATGETKVVLSDMGRVRDIVQLPSGDLLMSIDEISASRPNTGRIVRVSPAG